MKYLIMLFILISFASGQTLTEKDVITKSHINFTKEFIYFILSGPIEIDGHTFINDTCSNPIIYQATIDGISIFKKEPSTEYQHRKCTHDNCNIIHLEIKQQKITLPNYQPYLPNWQYYNNLN